MNIVSLIGDLEYKISLGYLYKVTMSCVKGEKMLSTRFRRHLVHTVSHHSDKRIFEPTGHMNGSYRTAVKWFDDENVYTGFEGRGWQPFSHQIPVRKLFGDPKPTTVKSPYNGLLGT